MILTDVYVLVYAYRQESPLHDGYAKWLSRVTSGSEELGLVDAVLIGFLRIVTNPRIYAEPAPTASALAFVDGLRHARRRRWLAPTSAGWESLASLVGGDPQVRVNLVPDAWLAALALAHGCRLATADRGFARFAGLDWFVPA
ncbi:MAG: TA system VapC family ribonuclease toxin [Acidimicrobiales bacterium]